MQCTSCNEGSLRPSFLDGLFRAHTCSRCKGDWILIEDFLAWKENNPSYQFADEIQFSEIDAEESKSALLCPITGAIMQKFKISAHNEHRVDYSANVGGIWLDYGEWELLKTEGLAGSLNALVTNQWQNQIRQESSKELFEEIYLQKFGDETYRQVREFRQWLYSQPLKSDLRAYLLAEDPYSAQK